MAVVLKLNTEHKKHNTSFHWKYYTLKIPSITLFTLSKPTVNTTHGPT